MTTTNETYAIKMTTDEGLVVLKNAFDAPGQYISNDSPWQGEPNEFVGENFSAAKSSAVEFLEDQIAMYQDWLADVKDCRKADTRAAR